MTKQTRRAIKEQRGQERWARIGEEKKEEKKEKKNSSRYQKVGMEDAAGIKEERKKRK